MVIWRLDARAHLFPRLVLNYFRQNFKLWIFKDCAFPVIGQDRKFKWLFASPTLQAGNYLWNAAVHLPLQAPCCSLIDPPSFLLLLCFIIFHCFVKCVCLLGKLKRQKSIALSKNEAPQNYCLCLMKAWSSPPWPCCIICLIVVLMWAIHLGSSEWQIPSCIKLACIYEWKS